MTTFNKIAKNTKKEVLSGNKKKLKDLEKELNSAYEFRIIDKDIKDKIQKLRNQFENENQGLLGKYQDEMDELSMRYMKAEIDILKKVNIIIKQ